MLTFEDLFNLGITDIPLAQNAWYKDMEAASAFNVDDFLTQRDDDYGWCCLSENTSSTVPFKLSDLVYQSPCHIPLLSYVLRDELYKDKVPKSTKWVFITRETNIIIDHAYTDGYEGDKYDIVKAREGILLPMEFSVNQDTKKVCMRPLRYPKHIRLIECYSDGCWGPISIPYYEEDELTLENCAYAVPNLWEYIHNTFPTAETELELDPCLLQKDTRHSFFRYRPDLWWASRKIFHTWKRQYLSPYTPYGKQRLLRDYHELTVCVHR